MGLLNTISKGANRFAGELLTPTSALGKLGAYLGAAGGGDLGLASMAAMRDQQQGQDAEIDRQFRLTQIARMNQPQMENNDTVQDYNFRVQMLGKEAADRWLQRGDDPDIALTLPGNRFYSGPRSGLGSALGGPVTLSNAPPNTAPGPVAGTVVNGMRFKGGDYRDQGNWVPLGGAAPQGAGTFR